MTEESQTPAQGVITEEYSAPAENALRAARTVAAYAIIARYNSAKESNVNSSGGHAAAREAAEQLFPYENSQGLQSFSAVRTIHTFHSDFFNQLPDNFYSLSPNQQIEVANSVIAKLGADNLKIGWLAIVNASSYDAFVAKMGGTSGPLWSIFDIDVIPLNDDATTNDIYQLMTPVNWGH
jgi:hypothetical protein